MNNCCLSQPCVNGGTCDEICDPKSVRYTCKCLPGYRGKNCELKTKGCQDIEERGGRTSRRYTILDHDDKPLKVYCDFHAELGHVWTLVQSYSLSNNHIYRSVSLYDYQASASFNSDKPNWNSYLVSPVHLRYLRNNSTHVRFTCNYSTDGNVYTDYARASLNEHFDLLVRPKRNGDCVMYDYVNIRGINCTNCTAGTYRQNHAVHIDSYLSKSRGCDFNGRPNSVKYEDNFGYYAKVNSAFRCTSNQQSTTQVWFGKH